MQWHLSDFFYVFLYVMYDCILSIWFIKERWWWWTNFVYVAMVIVYNGGWIFILVIYCVCYYFRSLDAENKWCRYYFAIYIRDSAVVLADNVWSSRQNYRPCVMVCRFCRPILSGNSTTPTKVGRLCRSSDIPFTVSFSLLIYFYYLLVTSFLTSSRCKQ